MRSIFSKTSWPARFSGPAFFLPLALLLIASLVPGARAASLNDHQAALAALTDLKAAIAEIVQANGSYSTNRNDYHGASQRAINALEGTHGPYSSAVAGTPGDELGAIGHIDALLDRKETPVWVDPLRGAEANMRAAVAHLLDANRARELMDFQIADSRALAYLEVALGRPTELGVFGGMEGALANTVLGVPAGATEADGCGTPTAAPAYGVHGGYVAWVAVPASEGTETLAENPGGDSVIVRNGVILLPTAAAALVAKACNNHAAAAPAAAPAAASAADALAKAAAAAASSAIPAVYTKAQAEAGAQIFASKCVACHGANMQGTAAPSVAGNDFLTTAEKNGWTLEVIRYLVVTDMPFNNPASLSPTEYANVLAFVLASNCYPAGTTPFPTSDNPEFAHIQMGPVPGRHPGQNSFGVCAVN